MDQPAPVARQHLRVFGWINGQERSAGDRLILQSLVPGKSGIAGKLENESLSAVLGLPVEARGVVQHGVAIRRGRGKHVGFQDRPFSQELEIARGGAECLSGGFFNTTCNRQKGYEKRH